MITKDEALGLVVLAGAGLAAYLIWQAMQKTKEIAQSASNAAGAVVNAVNPASDQNLIYQGVNAIGAGWTGDVNYSLGGAIYDYFNDEPESTGEGEPYRVEVVGHNKS